MKPLAVGSVFRDRVNPKPCDLASALGNTSVDVVSSPATIGYLEMACHGLMDELFEAGEASVGYAFRLHHLAGASARKPLDVEAVVIACDGKRFTFRVEASQGGKVIMNGEHERIVIGLERFLAKANA